MMMMMMNRSPAGLGTVLTISKIEGVSLHCCVAYVDRPDFFVFISVFELVNISIFVFVFVNVSKLFHHTTVATLVLMEFNRLICQNQSNTDWLVNI